MATKGNYYDDFTPHSRPWQSDGQFIVAPDPHGKYLDIYIAEIAETDEEGRIASPEQQDANKRLITASTELLDALLDIKRLAGKSGDAEVDPFTLLDMIADRTRAAITGTVGGPP